MLCLCAVPCVFIGEEGLLMCCVSGDMCTGFCAVRWLFGGSMVGLLVVSLCRCFLSFMEMPGLGYFLCTTTTHHGTASGAGGLRAGSARFGGGARTVRAG